MVITESKAYKKTEKKILKNKPVEQEKLKIIKDTMFDYENLHEYMLSEYKIIYNIRKKEGNLKEFYSASLNPKIRLIFKPVGKYPYNEVEIVELEFVEINNNHYKGVR